MVWDDRYWEWLWFGVWRCSGNGSPLPSTRDRGSNPTKPPGSNQVDFERANAVRGYEKKEALRRLLGSLRGKEPEEAEIEKLLPDLERVPPTSMRFFG